MIQRFAALLLLIALLPYDQPIHAQTPAWAWPDEWLADSAFFNIWARTDAPVAMQAASRSWLWGPVPFAVANEPYAESPTGLRLVEYLDKGRMEVNDPYIDRSSPWFVTSGLLVKEMVTGQVQTGNSTFEPTAPATTLVAGDPGSPDAPTYAAFVRHMGYENNMAPPPGSDFIETLPALRIARDGTLTRIDDTLPVAYREALLGTHFDSVTGHNVPWAFDRWMNQSGPVLEKGRISDGPLLDPLYVLGRPITEPYWADIRIDGHPTTILIQLYERRALTYNPNNPPEWRVEMANVGRAYYDWRYAQSLPTPAIATYGSDLGILFRGYNWPPSALVRINIGLAGSETPFIGPNEITAGLDGRFTALMVPTEPLKAAQASFADVKACAESGGVSVALPFNTDPIPRVTQIAGTLIGIENTVPDGSSILHVEDLDGNLWTIRVTPYTSFRYTNNTPATASSFDIGLPLDFSTTSQIDGTYASSIKYLSLSGTSAVVGYQWSPDGKSLIVSGTGWPGETGVSLGFVDIPLIPMLEYQLFGFLQTDSRGNLFGGFEAGDYRGKHWLRIIANAPEAVTIHIPVAPPPANNAIPPPQLSISSQQGAQLATIGPYCWAKLCAEISPSHMPFPSFALPVQPGETLTFRSQYGPDSNAGLTPVSFFLSVQTSNGHPVYSIDRQPGSPFSHTIPQSITPGTYLMRTTVTWPDPSGGTGDVTYGLSIEVK